MEARIDCYILTQSSSDHRSTSSGWAAQPWVLRAQALCLELVLTPAPYLQLELQLEHQLTRTDWLKPSVAPGYIIVWHPPTSCGRTHLHRIQPRPQVKVIFRYLRPDAPVSPPFRLFTQVHLLIDSSVTISKNLKQVLFPVFQRIYFLFQFNGQIFYYK